MDPAVRSATIRAGSVAAAVAMAVSAFEVLTGWTGWISTSVFWLAMAVFALAIARYSQNKGRSCYWGLLALAGPLGGVMAGKLPDRTRRGVDETASLECRPTPTTPAPASC